MYLDRVTQNISNSKTPGLTQIAQLIKHFATHEWDRVKTASVFVFSN